MPVDEKKLVQRLQKKQRGALEQAMQQYTAYVAAAAWRAMGQWGTREDVEEVAADVFVALWAHAGQLDPAQGLRPWLGAVARNKATDRLRRLRPALPLEEAADLGSGPLPEEEAQRRDDAQRLWLAVDAMGEPDRTLFFRHYYGGEKLKDVARDLGLNLSTAKSRLRRGREALRAKWMEGGGTL